MAALILPSRWTQQPPGAIELDPSHWAHDAIANCVSFTKTVDLRTGTPLAVVGAEPLAVGCSGGNARRFDVASNRYTFAGSAANSPSKIMIVAVASVDAGAGNSFFVSKNYNGSSVPYVLYGKFTNRSAQLGFGFYNGAWQTTSGSDIRGTGVRNIAGSYDGSNLKAFLDGKLDSSAAYSGALPDNANPVDIGGYVNDATPVYGNIALLYIINGDRAHPTTEMGAHLSANPWQIFRPIVRRIYFDLGAGGSAVGTTSTPRWNALAYAPKSNALRWNMLAAVAKTGTLRWDALVTAAQSSTPRWNALKTAQQNAVARWNAIAVALKTATPRWDALAVVPKTTTPRWDALTTAAKSSTIRWDMLSSVILAGTDVTLRWNSIAIAQKLATARWNSLVVASQSSTQRWNALTTAAKSASTRWDLIAAVQQTVAPHWNLLATAGLSDALRWNMTQAVARAVAARWNLVSTVAVAQTVTLRWHSISVSGKNVVCRWQVGDTGNTHYSYIDVLVLPEENRVMVLSAPNNVITIH